MEVSAVDTPLDVARVKKDFPILERLVHGKRLVYLDSASSSQKPTTVIEGMSRYYESTHANVHRGVYEIAQEATRLYEEARAKLARFIGASSADEVIFTKNATEAINLVAYAWGRKNLGASDVVVTSEIEHHANFVPWLQLRGETGTELRFLRLGEDGMLVLDDLAELLDGAKLLAVTAASNVLGTLPPVRALADAAHAAGALVLRRRRPVRPAHAHFGDRPGGRLRGVHRAQDAGANGYRGALGTTRAARSDASVPNGWRDDP